MTEIQKQNNARAVAALKRIHHHEREQKIKAALVDYKENKKWNAASVTKACFFSTVTASQPTDGAANAVTRSHSKAVR